MQTDLTVAHSELFHGHEPSEGKSFLLDLTVVKPCAPTDLDDETKRLGVFIIETVNKKQKVS